jgi:predicted MFS family arabinose efflux permease
LEPAEWLLLLVLAGVQFTHSMDFMVLVPLGPQCREELDITPEQFAWVVGSYGFAAAAGGLLAASVIDRFGRRSVLLFLYGGFTLGTLFCAVAPTYGWLLLARSLVGCFGGIVGAVIMVIIGDAIPEARRGRATGVVMTAFSVASIAGLPAGIMLGNRYGVRAPFGALAFVAAGVFVAAFRILPPLRGHLGSEGASSAGTLSVLTRPAHLRAYALTVLLVAGSFTVAPHFGDFLVHNVGRSKDDLAYVYLCGGLASFLTLPQVGRLADWFGKRQVFHVMAACTLVTMLVMTNLPPVPLAELLTVTTLYFVFTSGRWVPAMALVTASAAPRYRGSFMSLNSAVQQLSMGLAATVAGAVVREGADGRLTGYSTAGLLAAAATAASMVLIRRLRPAEETGERPQEKAPTSEPAVCLAEVDCTVGQDARRP